MQSEMDRWLVVVVVVVMVCCKKQQTGHRKLMLTALSM